MSGDVTIPSEAGNFRHKYKVIEIPSFAFYGCNGLTSVTIPNSITSIGGHTFWGCSALTSVTIPNSVTSIGESAFEKCGGLTSMNIPNSVTSIGKSAFYDCSRLTSVTIPNSITSIGGHTFYGCSRLTSVTIPNSITSIGGYTFFGCSALTSVTIPNSVTSIGESAFEECSGLTSVTIPNSITSIGGYTFNGCESLTSIVIPNSVTSIGDYAFNGCIGLKEIYLLNPTPPTASKNSFDNYNYKNVILYVPQTAFDVYDRAIEGPWKYFLYLEAYNPVGIKYSYDTDNMTATIIGADKDALPANLVIYSITEYQDQTYNVVAIGNNAFTGCSDLTSVTIPYSITSIGSYTFNGCSGLTKIYPPSPTPPNAFENSFDEQHYQNVTLFIPVAVSDAYKAANPWKKFHNIQEIPQKGIITCWRN